MVTRIVFKVNKIHTEGGRSPVMDTCTPVRIAHIVGKVVTGGVDAVVMNYYRNIDREKIQFDFFMDGHFKTPVDHEILSMGGRIYKLEPYEKNLLKNLRQCQCIWKENDYQIVHVHLNTLSVFWLAAAFFSKIPMRIIHNHSTAAKGEGKRALMKYLLRPFAKIFATHYAACSRYAGEWMFGKSLVESGKVKIIPNAIEVARYSYNPVVREQMREELGLADKLVIGHVGRFAYQKNHHFLVDIFSALNKQRSDAMLLLIGTGELEQSIREKVRALELEESVRFLGVRHDVPALLQAMDVFVLPSFFEGLPVVGVEAQAAGLPCLLSDAMTAETKLTGMAEFFSLGETAEEWAAKTMQMLAGFERRGMDSELKDAGFDIKVAANELAEWYREVCA